MKITKVTAYPLLAKLKRPQATSQAVYTEVSICVVRVKTDEGIEGVGECLARFGANAYAKIIEDLLAPVLVGSDPFSIGELWQRMRARLNGRSGGMLFEAMAGVDIALWDILGKAHDAPVARLLGGNNRRRVPAYASSIMVDEDVTEAGPRAVSLGFSIIKLKIGGSVRSQIERARSLRKAVGDEVIIVVDANFIYGEDEALYLARGLAESGVRWLEEPINPENREGYLRLSRQSPVPLAAGESEFTAHDFTDMLSRGAVKFAQPDVARASGISETWRIALLANAFGIRYAPHVGHSGIICIAASLQLAAAAPNTFAYECMVTPSIFREELALEPVGLYSQVKRGEVEVPDRPGLGIELDWRRVEQLVQ